ncbi:MAG: MFS transporter [Candidatus Rokuibacteriota bacterium]
MLRTLAAAGAFVVSLDSTVNIAFPAMAAAFAAPPERMRWVIICYVLTYALMSFAGGALGDRWGHGRVFRAGLALSVAAFVLCGAAPTFGWLLAGRVVQGVAGGLVYGTTPALVTLGADAAARGRALGFLNSAIGLAFALGPLVAGALVEHFGWPAVFYLRVPLALGVLGWSLAQQPRGHPRRATLLAGAGDLARGSVLGAGALAFLAQAGIFAVWLLAPFDLIERRGLDPLVGGALFMLTPLGTAVAAPLAGRLGDRLGSRPLMTAGLAVEAAGLFVIAVASPPAPVAVLAVGLFAAGLGLGVFQVPNMATLMAEFPAGQQGVAGGFAFLARTLGTVGGVALLAHVFAERRAAAGFDAAYGLAFGVAAGLVSAGTVAALVWTVRRPARQR